MCAAAEVHCLKWEKKKIPKADITFILEVQNITKAIFQGE